MRLRAWLSWKHYEVIMKRKIKALSKQYDNLEEKIRNELGKLENAGCSCDCDDCETITLIHYGNYDEMEVFCLNCGGFIDEVQ